MKIEEKEVVLLKKEIKALSETRNDIEKQLEIKKSELLHKVLACEKIINEALWRIDEKSNTLMSNTCSHKKLADFLQTDYHCHFESNENLKLFFDDNDITLCFSSSRALFNFINLYKVKIDVSVIIGHRDRLKEAILQNEKELQQMEQSIINIQKDLCV